MTMEHTRTSRPVRGSHIIAFGAALCATVALVLTGTSPRHATEATAQMEQLAGRIDRARILQPETARQLVELINSPQYDCTRIACSRELQDRNRTARVRLEQAIAGKLHAGSFVAAGHAPD
jgi:hypothetical protein